MSITIILLILIGIVIFSFGSNTVLYYLYSKRPLPRFKNKIFPTATIIIPFYNEEVGMKAKVQDIAKLKYPKNKLNILFVNDHSTDNGVMILKENMSKIPFKTKLIHNPGNQGKKNAMFYGISKVKTEITMINDADSEIKKDALEKLVQNYQNPQVGGANVRMDIKSKSKNKIYQDEKGYRKFYDLWRMGESNIHSISVCNGILMSFRTDIIKEIKLESDADDTELAIKVIGKGYTVVYEPRAIVYETLPEVQKERTKQKMRRARGVIIVYLKNLSLLGKNKFGNIVFPYALMSFIVSPWMVLIGILIYFYLIFQNYFYLFGLLLFVFPKLGSFSRSFISTQLLMAFSPFMAKGWNTTKSSREDK